MKKIIKASVFCATVLAAAASAQAASFTNIDLNVFGASAQFDFWNEAAPQFLKAPVASGGMGCTSEIHGKADSKNGVAKGYNCAANGGSTVTIRYTADKSVEGPRAVMGMDPLNLDSCSTQVNKTWSGDDHYRVMANISDAGVLTKDCNRVNLGASDVASESFTQESHGNTKGWSQLGVQFDDALDPATIPGSSVPGMHVFNPIVVPFSFFANKALTTTNNLTRLQAVLLFSGNVANWQQFGPSYPNAKVALCFRHAGSGTHATLDRAVLRGEAALPSFEEIVGDGVPFVLFHSSADDLMPCVNNNGIANSGAIAVGYADTDKLITSIDAAGNEVINPAYSNIKRMTYNGAGKGMSAGLTEAPIKTEIKNGSYDFWSAQWVYMAPTAGSTELAAAQKMMTYAANPATLPQATKKYYWSAQSELNVIKENDSVLPHF